MEAVIRIALGTAIGFVVAFFALFIIFGIVNVIGDRCG